LTLSSPGVTHTFIGVDCLRVFPFMASISGGSRFAPGLARLKTVTRYSISFILERHSQQPLMNIEIHDTALEARIQKQIQATGAASAEEALLRLLETQEEQDRWLLENKNAISAKIRRGIDQLDRGEGIPKTNWALTLPKAVDLDVASKLDAAATLLGRKML
jgi:hypothetical protein